MKFPSSGPSKRRRQLQASAATAPPTSGNAPLDPHLVPFLDLLAELVARHIVAEQAIGGGEEVPPYSPPLESTLSVEKQPGNASPIPTAPVQSQGRSHANPKPAVRRTARGGTQETP